MDNLTHSLAGWALAETGLKRKTRLGLAALVLAANMPDIDVFFGWAPWPPLAMHRGFTHGLVGGVLVMPPMLAGLLWLLDRWRMRHGGDPVVPMHFGWLVVLAYIGAVSHPLLDLQNTYAVQLLSPLSERWFHTDALFILSPVLDVLLGAGIWRARRKWRQGRPGAGWPAIAGLFASIAFIAANLVISVHARSLPARLYGARPDRLFAGPEPIAFWRREVVWREDGTIRTGRYDPLRSRDGITRLGEPLPDRMDEPLVRRAIAGSAEIRDFLAWSQLPFARTRISGCSATVTFGDGRYTDPRAASSFTHEAQVRLGPGDGAQIPCPPR